MDTAKKLEFGSEELLEEYSEELAEEPLEEVSSKREQDKLPKICISLESDYCFLFRKEIREFREEEMLANSIIESVYAVHDRLSGLGLEAETVYRFCFCNELRRRGFKLEILHGLCLVEDSILCAVKFADDLTECQASITTRLRSSGKRLGFVLNFKALDPKDGIIRITV